MQENQRQNENSDGTNKFHLNLKKHCSSNWSLLLSLMSSCSSAEKEEKVYLPKRFTSGLSHSGEMHRVFVGCVCSWKQTSSMHFFDYAQVI